jgi:hypothetical protein
MLLISLISSGPVVAVHDVLGIGTGPTQSIMAAPEAGVGVLEIFDLELEALLAILGAMDEGDTEGFASMLDEDPRLLNAMLGALPLPTWAAMEGHVGMVRLLLERGAGVNATTIEGDTALHYAARRGREEVVSLLLSSGADPSRIAAGWTALLSASHMGHVAVVRLLLRSMGGHGLDERNEDGRTALWCACCDGHADIVQALLLAGVDHTIADNEGTTPQQVAQDNHHPECAALIKVRGTRSPMPLLRLGPLGPCI